MTDAVIAMTSDLQAGLGGTAGYGETEVGHNDRTITTDLSGVFTEGLRLGSETLSIGEVQTMRAGTVIMHPDLPTGTWYEYDVDNLAASFGSAAWALVPYSAVFIQYSHSQRDYETHATSPVPAPVRAVDVDEEAGVATFTWAGLRIYGWAVDLPQEDPVNFQTQLFDRGAGNFDVVVRLQDIVGARYEWQSMSSGIVLAGEVQSLAETREAIDTLDSTPGNTGIEGLWIFEYRTFDGTDADDSLSLVGEYDTVGFGFLLGGAGADTLTGSTGTDKLDGGAGADVLIGGEGIDTASYASATEAFTLDVQFAQLSTGDAQGDSFDGIEQFEGSSGVNQMRGTASADMLSGMGGDDWLFGRQGADMLMGGDGDDMLDGGSGADTLSGGDGADTAFYRFATSGVRVDLDHADKIDRGARGDVLDSVENIIGSRFDDNLAGSNSSRNRLEGGAGDDWLFSRGTGDTLAGGTGDDVLTGINRGEDAFRYWETQVGDTFVFSGGHDRIRYFDDDVDTIHVAREIMPEGQNVLGLLFLNATLSGDDVVIEFADDHSLTIEGTTDIGGLLDDLVVI